MDQNTIKPTDPASNEDFTDAVCIPLTQGKHCLIDASDYDLVAHVRWQASDRGYATRRPCRKIQTGTKIIRMHRLLTAAPDGMFVDHANCDKLDNRRKNLRICTRQENHRNRPPHKKRAAKSSRFKGVCYHKQGRKWTAVIVVDRKNIHLGLYSTEEEAALAYNAAATAHFGEFARLNPIPASDR